MIRLFTVIAVGLIALTLAFDSNDTFATCATTASEQTASCNDGACIVTVTFSYGQACPAGNANCIVNVSAKITGCSSLIQVKQDCDNDNSYTAISDATSIGSAGWSGQVTCACPTYLEGTKHFSVGVFYQTAAGTCAAGD